MTETQTKTAPEKSVDVQRVYRGLDHVWHLGHQYEMLKFPFVDWSWVVEHKRHFSTGPRGQLDINFVPHYEPGKYDFALLHLDQQVVEPNIYNRGKCLVFKELNEVIQDIPKIVLMHGTPYYPEKFDPQAILTRVRDLVGDMPMVVNSHTAADQWAGNIHGKQYQGIPRSQIFPIIHGMDAAEWWDLPKEPRVVTMISPAGLDKYYDRVFLEAIRDELANRGIQFCQITMDWQARDWDDYREFLGRSLVYVNPTRESPMPRSRTEAMLSGCCVLTTPHQDADTFIEHGKNGFIIPRNPEAVADMVEERIANYKESVEIGQRGKETAMRLFNSQRYQQDWLGLLQKIIGT
jgi:glycosyltransferase involved in cell wall biosynthesis